MPDQLFFDIVKMVVALACIVGLIFGVVFVLKRLMPGSVRGGAERIDLRVLAQLSMGSRQRICVLRVHDRTLVVGVTEGSITTLAELPTKRPDAPKDADDPQIFADLLSWRKDGTDAVQRGAVDAAEPPLAPRAAAKLQDPRPAANADDHGDGPALFAPGGRPSR